MRVLHVIEGARRRGGGWVRSGLGAALCAGLKRSLEGWEHRVVAIGASGPIDGVDGLVRTAGGGAWSAWGGLRRWAAAHGPFDAVHAVGAGALRAVRLAGFAPVVVTDVGAGGSVGRRVARGVRAVVLAAGDAGRWKAAGAGVEVVEPPAVEADGVGVGWRGALGIGEGERVLGLVGSGGDAYRFVFVLGMVELAGMGAVGVVAEGSEGIGRGLRLRRSVGLVSRVVVAGWSEMEVVSASDGCVWLGGGEGERALLEGAARRGGRGFFAGGGDGSLAQVASAVMEWMSGGGKAEACSGGWEAYAGAVGGALAGA